MQAIDEATKEIDCNACIECMCCHELCLHKLFAGQHSYSYQQENHPKYLLQQFMG